MKNNHLLFVTLEVDFIDHFGIACLSAVAGECGWKPHMAVLDRGNIDDVMQRIKPEMVCYSVMSTDAAMYLKLNKYLKSKYEFVSVMGGPHPTYFPEVIEQDGLDFICRGEGEAAFKEFLNRFREGGDYQNVPNFWSKASHNDIRELIADLDSLPFPDRGMVFDNSELGGSLIKTFMTSRGCPFSCSYCHNNSLKALYKGKGKHYRVHSVDRVIEEINMVRSKYECCFIKFEDDLFAASSSWLEDFAHQYKNKVGIPFNCLQRFELVNRDRVNLLKEAGCVSMSLSTESANPRIRREILKRSMSLTNDEIKEKMLMIKAAGINVLTSFIVGVPTSTIEDELDGIQLSIAGSADFSGAAILFPFPGTEIHAYCKEHKLLPDTITEAGASLQQKSLLKGFSEREKEIQWNLSCFFPLIVKYPVLRKPLLNLALKARAWSIFSFVHVLGKSYLYSKYIFPIKGRWLIKLGMLMKAFAIETRQKLGIRRRFRL